jgi:hypothetical protein
VGPFARVPDREAAVGLIVESAKLWRLTEVEAKKGARRD